VHCLVCYYRWCFKLNIVVRICFSDDTNNKMEQKRLKEFADYERNYILTINYKSNTVYSVNL